METHLERLYEHFLHPASRSFLLTYAYPFGGALTTENCRSDQAHYSVVFTSCPLTGIMTGDPGRFGPPPGAVPQVIASYLPPGLSLFQTR